MFNCTDLICSDIFFCQGDRKNRDCSEMNGIAKSKRENIQNCQNHNSNNNENNTNIGDVDPWTAWMYKPRTISLLLCGTCLLM